MNTPLLGPEMRAMRRELASAPDAQVLQVLRLVDAMADRGQADALLAPLRERLRVLRPPRPLRLSRLLFLPLDPVIVPANAWRPEQALLPRNAILPLTELVRAGLPAQVEAVEQEITRNTQAGPALGRLIWPQAGKLLRLAQPPPSWLNAGLRAADFAPLAAATACCLENALTLAQLSDASLRASELNAALQAVLEAAQVSGPVAWGMQLTIMLQLFPRAEAPRRAATAPRSDRAMRACAEGAQTQCLDWIEQSASIPGLGDLTEAADAAHRQVSLLDAFLGEPAHRKRAAALAATLGASITAQIEAGIALRVQAKLAGIEKLRDPGTVLTQMEADLRALRRMDLDLKRLGGQAGTAQLRSASQAVLAAPGLTAMDRARLMEILAGAQEAAKLLGRRQS